MSRPGLFGFAVVGWAVVVAAGLASRPLLPVDETRYLAVAWEMWSNREFLVPHLNGAAYHHKPPLLFWLMALGWTVFGVSETWARLVSPLFALASLVLTARLASLLFPDTPRAAGLAPVILMGTALFAVFASPAYFDTLVTFFTLGGLIGVVLAWRGRPRLGWLMFAAALGLGVLAKGPVVLFYLVPVPLSAPVWMERVPSWRHWYGGLGLAVIGGAALALAWAVPAAIAGGEAFARMLFVGQHVGRIAESFQHGRPWWWYGPVMLLALYPWPLWGAVWRARPWPAWSEPGLRFCLAQIVPALILLSAISGKQPHYLLPLFPALALIAARIVAGEVGDRRGDRLPATAVLLAAGIALAAPLLAASLSGFTAPPWVAAIHPSGGAALVALALWLALDRARLSSTRAASLAAVVPAILVAVHLAAFGPAIRPYYDTAPAAAVLARAEQAGRPIAHVGDYHGQFHFAGRLRRPLSEITADDAASWAKRHPDGIVIAYRRDDPAAFAEWPLFWQVYRGRHVVIWEARDVAEHGPYILTDRGR
ncbi:MAG: ArnT family glycosyltransferase [Pseudomonadota bacterium]